MPKRSVNLSPKSLDPRPPASSSPSEQDPQAENAAPGASPPATGTMPDSVRMLGSSANDIFLKAAGPFCQFLARVEAEEARFRAGADEATARYESRMLEAEEHELGDGLTPRHVAFAASMIQARAERLSAEKDSPWEKREARKNVWGPFCRPHDIEPVENLTEFLLAMNRWDRVKDQKRIRRAVKKIRSLTEHHACDTGQEVPRTERGPKIGGECVLSLSFPTAGTRKAHRLTRESLRDGIPGGPSADEVKDLILDILGEDGLREILDHSAREEAAVNGS